MMSLDQIERELNTIEKFDVKFLSEPVHSLEEMIGYRMREKRRQELCELMASRAVGNA